MSKFNTQFAPYFLDINSSNNCPFQPIIITYMDCMEMCISTAYIKRSSYLPYQYQVYKSINWERTISFSLLLDFIHASVHTHEIRYALIKLNYDKPYKLPATYHHSRNKMKNL